MIVAIVFAHAWGALSLTLLGSLTRTVRVRTVLAALAVGLYAIAPLTVLLQLGWIHPVASLLGMSVPDLTRVASYSLDPFIEEALKLLPLATLLLLIPAIRRQWSFTDCVLVAAATGSGFGLAENIYRYAGSPDSAHAIAGGWAIVIGTYTLLVPGIVSTLTSWLPAGTVPIDESITLNSHLVWSAMGGLAVGLIVRNGSKRARLVAGALFLYIGLDHAVGNAALNSDTWLSPLTTPFHSLAEWGGVMVLATLVTAWWLDRPAQRTGDAAGPLLAAERVASPRIVGTLRAALSRLPFSMLWVCGFARARRAYQAARAATSPGHNDVLAAMVVERDRIDRYLTQIESPPLLPSGSRLSAWRSTLRRPAVIFSLVLLLPSILYLVIGGWPQTAWLQSLMTGPIVWPMVLVITAVAQARLAWSVIVGARNWSKSRRFPIGDDAALAGFKLACGVGAVGLGGFTLLRVFDGVAAGSSLISGAHAAAAANRVTPGLGAAVANSGGANDPPPPSLDLPEDAAPSKPPAPKADASPRPPAPKPAPPSQPRPSPADAAARAEARAAQAEAAALNARQLRIKANNALDAAEIAERTADPGADPTVAAARERARRARDAAEAADRAALDGDDPWDPKAPKKTAADDARRAAKAAEAEQRAAEDAFAERKAAETASAKAAAKAADDALNAADAKAAAAREAANGARHAAVDPLGAAADKADKDYAAAQAREAQASKTPGTKASQAAHRATAAAKARAEEARAAANTARDVRAASVIGVDKP